MTELPERRAEHALPAPAEMRHTLARLTYEDAESVRDAAALRERAAAIADVAKRAHVDEVEYALVAREAERALGRMLIAGREAGDVAAHGGDRSNIRAADLADLGVERNLAADAARFAQIADELWADVVKRARETEAVSRSAFRAAVAGTMGPRQPEPSSVEYQIRLFERGEYGERHGSDVTDNPPIEHQHLPAAWDETDEARRRLIKRRISDPLDGLVCGLYRWSGPWRAQCPCCGRFEVHPEPISDHFDMQHVPELLDMQHPPDLSRVLRARARKEKQRAETWWQQQRESAETPEPPTVVFSFDTPEQREELVALLGIEVSRSTDPWVGWYPAPPDDGQNSLL